MGPNYHFTWLHTFSQSLILKKGFQKIINCIWLKYTGKKNFKENIRHSGLNGDSIIFVIFKLKNLYFYILFSYLLII